MIAIRSGVAAQLTGADAKAMKQMVNATWIYPPLDSAEAILAQAGTITNG